MGRVILHPHKIWLPVPERCVLHKNVIVFSACFLSLFNAEKMEWLSFVAAAVVFRISVLFIHLLSALVPAADV